MKAAAFNSVFLTGNEPGKRDFDRVLVLGGDRIGLELATRLAEEQFQVLLIGQADQKTPDNKIAVLQDAVLEEISGFAGDFQACLRTSTGILTEHVGAIVAAQPASLRTKFESYGIRADARTLSLSQLEMKIQTAEPMPRSREGWFHAAFLLGLEGESDPEIFDRALTAIEHLKRIGQIQCYVFTRNVKVAADGLERRYRECRENGTLFFKFDGEGPVFEQTSDETTIIFKEPLLGSEMELVPDILVVDEDYAPPCGLEPIWATMPSSPSYKPYLQPESPRFASVETPKAGILAIGASRGAYSRATVDSDIEVVVSDLKLLKSSPPSVNGVGLPKIDPEKCAVCLTCVRLCPHGAMGFTRYAFVDPISCMRCGICAAACPMSAITIEPSADQRVVSQCIEAEFRGNSKKRICVFLCSHSGADAAEHVADQIADSVALVKVPCAGTVDLAHILASFQEGAKAVMVTGCFKGNCASIYGTSLAEEKVRQAASAFQEIGIKPDRVVFIPMAANTPGVLLTALKEMEEKITR